MPAVTVSHASLRIAAKTVSQRTSKGKPAANPRKRGRRAAPKPTVQKSLQKPRKSPKRAPTAPQPTSLRVKHQRADPLLPGVPRGAGTKRDPVTIPLRAAPNASGCLHCPIGIDSCLCREIDGVISAALETVYASTPMRRTHAFGRHPLNSKSVLPVFVTRILRLLSVSAADAFWDLGCGIGNVVMQAALQHGASAVGVDIQAENIAVAKKTWGIVQREWKRRYPSRRIGNVEFFAGDMFAELSAIQAGGKSQSPESMRPTAVWMSNQLFTPQMNHQLADFMGGVPSIRAVAAMLDLFPHERVGITQKRNPRPYAKFPVMRDHMTQENALEWSATEERPFYIYAQKE